MGTETPGEMRPADKSKSNQIKVYCSASNRDHLSNYAVKELELAKFTLSIIASNLKTYEKRRKN